MTEIVVVASLVLVALMVLVLYLTHPRCAECGASDPLGHGPLGSWWHNDGCSFTGPFLSTDEDDE